MKVSVAINFVFATPLIYYLFTTARSYIVILVSDPPPGVQSSMYCPLLTIALKRVQRNRPAVKPIPSTICFVIGLHGTAVGKSTVPSPRISVAFLFTTDTHPMGECIGTNGAQRDVNVTVLFRLFLGNILSRLTVKRHDHRAVRTVGGEHPETRRDGSIEGGGAVGDPGSRRRKRDARMCIACRSAALLAPQCSPSLRSSNLTFFRED